MGSEFTISGTLTKSDSKGKLPVVDFDLNFTSEENHVIKFHGFVNFFRGYIDGKYQDYQDGPDSEPTTEGIFKINEADKKSGRVRLKFVLDYTKSESDKIVSEMTLNLCDMHFKSADE